jgi:hypothetical protein
VHFNQCWDVLRDKARATGKRETREVLGNIEIEESDEVTVKILSDITSALAELEGPSAPELPYSTDLPTTLCLLCHKDLWDMKALDAFHYRVTCISTLSPTSCPVCKQSFTEIPEPSTEANAIDVTSWEIYDQNWHLYACQNACHLSLTAQKDYNDLVSRYADQIDVAERICSNMFGERKGWTGRKHRANVKAKKDLGLAKQDGIYRIPNSPLRNCQRILPPRRWHSGTEIEVTRSEKEVVAEKISFDLFKLSSYSVLCLPRKATIRKSYKARKVVTETISVFDSRAFWSKLSHQGISDLPPKPVPKSFDAACLLEGKSLVDSAAAEKFPLICDKSRGRSRLRSVQPPQGDSFLETPLTIVGTPLKANMRRLRLKGPNKVNSNRKKLPAESKKSKEEVKRSPSKSPVPLKPDVAGEAGEAGVLPRSVRRFPDITHTCPQEEPVTLPWSVRQFLTTTFVCPQEEPIDLLASPPPATMEQTTKESCTSIQPRSNMTFKPTTTMKGSPVRLPGAPTDTSPSVIMPRRNSLEGTRPYMFPAPYAHTTFFSDDSFLVFGEGEVPPPPSSVRYSDADGGETVRQEEPVHSTDAGPQQEPESVTTASVGGEGMGQADEMDAHDNSHSCSSSPTSPKVPVTPSAVASLESSPPVRNERTTRRPAPLRPEMFLNPDETDQEINVETYTYGSRGAIPVALRSNIQTVTDPSLSESEQTARNRERCKGMFGSFTETSGDL